MSDCDVCNNSTLLNQATCNEKAFNWSVLKTLCYIVEKLEAIASEEVVASSRTTLLSQVERSDTQINTGYQAFTTIGLVDSTKQLNYIRVVNQTDISLSFSLNGGATVAFTVLPATIYERELNIAVSSSTSIQMKAEEADAEGYVLIEGSYQS